MHAQQQYTHTAPELPMQSRPLSWVRGSSHHLLDVQQHPKQRRGPRFSTSEPEEGAGIQFNDVDNPKPNSEKTAPRQKAGEDQPWSSVTTDLLAQFCQKSHTADLSSPGSKLTGHLRGRAYPQRRASTKLSHSSSCKSAKEVKVPDGIRAMKIGAHSVVTEAMLSEEDYSEQNTHAKSPNRQARVSSPSILDGAITSPPLRHSSSNSRIKESSRLSISKQLLNADKNGHAAGGDKQAASSPLSWRFHNRLALSHNNRANTNENSSLQRTLSTISFDDVNIPRHRSEECQRRPSNITLEDTSTSSKTMEEIGYSDSYDETQRLTSSSSCHYVGTTPGATPLGLESPIAHREDQRSTGKNEDYEEELQYRLPEISPAQKTRPEHLNEESFPQRKQLLVGVSVSGAKRLSKSSAMNRSFTGCLSSTVDGEPDDLSVSTDKEQHGQQKQQQNGDMAKKEASRSSFFSMGGYSPVKTAPLMDSSAFFTGEALPALRVTSLSKKDHFLDDPRASTRTKDNPKNEEFDQDQYISDRPSTGTSEETKRNPEVGSARENPKHSRAVAVIGSQVTIGSGSGREGDANSSAAEESGKTEESDRRESQDMDSTASEGNNDQQSNESACCQENVQSASSSAAEEESYPEPICDNFGGLLETDGSLHFEQVRKEWDDLFHHVIERIAEDLVCLPDRGAGPLHYRCQGDLADDTRETSDGILRAIFEEQRSQLEADEAQQVSATKRHQRVRIKQMERERMKKKWAGRG